MLSCVCERQEFGFLTFKVRRNKELKERVRLSSSLTKLLLSPSQASQLCYVLHITHSYIHPKVSQNANVFLSHRAEGLLWVPTSYFSLGLPTLPQGLGIGSSN